MPVPQDFQINLYSFICKLTGMLTKCKKSCMMRPTSEWYLHRATSNDIVSPLNMKMILYWVTRAKH